MALIAAHLNAGHSGGNSVAIGIYSPSSPVLLEPKDDLNTATTTTTIKQVIST